jgi:phosphate/sulfate permease
MAGGTPFNEQDARRRRLARAEAMQLARNRRWEKRKANMGKRVTRGFLAFLAALVAFTVYGWTAGGAGIGLFLLALILVPMAGIAGMLLPIGGPDGRNIDKAQPAELPAITEAFLERQRRQLPRLAAPQLDGIAVQLAALETQLARVPADHPVAQDIGRLLGNHLPELVDRYTRIPPIQRANVVEHDGRTPEATVVDGLKTVEAELARASALLAETDRDGLRVQGKFLEARYGEGQG